MSKCRCRLPCPEYFYPSYKLPSSHQQRTNQNSAECAFPLRCAFCTHNRNYVPEGRIARLFNESSRGAFDRIESVVMAVNSVADMLSSTHHAIYSSFRAVIGALDEFARLKTQLRCLMSSAALLNWLRYIWRLLLNCVKLRSDGVLEEAWRETQRMPVLLYQPQRASSNPFCWLPSVMFWMIAIGVPSLVYYSLSQMKAYMEDTMRWSTGQDEYYEAVATDDYNGHEEGTISLKCGEKVRIAPRQIQPRRRGYLLASSEDGKRIGAVPMNKIRLLQRIVETPSVLTGQDVIQLFDDARAFENDLKR